MSDPQYIVALKKANRVKAQRAVIKRDVKAGRTSICQLTVNTPPEIETMPVFDMLLMLNRYGRLRALRVIEKVRMSEYTTFGDLTDRQKEVLSSLL